MDFPLTLYMNRGLHNADVQCKSIPFPGKGLNPVALVHRLPKDIAYRIFIYIIDCVGISKDLSTDIQHFVKCRPTLRIREILYNSGRVLKRAIKFMKHKDLFSKYNRKMISVTYVLDQKYWEKNFKVLRKEKIALTDFENYAEMPLWYQESGLDNRPNKYSILVTEPENPDYANMSYMSCHRALHNLVCMLTPEDRAALMTDISYYYCRYMDYYDEEYDEDAEYYQYEDDTEFLDSLL